MYPYLHTERSPCNLEIMVFPCNRTAPLIQQVVIEKF